MSCGSICSAERAEVLMELREKAYAKLNISLDVGAKRDDGYHEMNMVMQTVSLCDELTVAQTDDGRISARSNLRFIPSDDRNLAVKAAKVFQAAAGSEGQGLLLTLKKRIPVGAGMAGGSSDAAAVLRALNRMHGGRFSRTELETLAGQVGSDVAFCVAGGTALAKGRGEILEALPPLPACAIAICKPEFSISTPELFRKLDSAPLRHHPDTAGILEALARGELRAVCRRMYNVFEDVGDRRMRTVCQIKSRMLDFGALGSIMTGTGSAVFGIFSDRGAAQAAARSLEKDYKFACVAEPVGRLPE